MENPFRYGESVTGEWFANRKTEIKDIVECIRAGQNIFIYSYRRLGKTSLIKFTLEKVSRSREAIPIYVDLHRAPTLTQFVETYSTSIAKSFGSSRGALAKVGAFFKNIVPSFQVDPEGKWQVSFDFSKTKGGVERALEEVYELPQMIAQKRRKRVVVVFDEFQEIAQYNGEAFEKHLRSFVQHHDKVCYIFMGSKTHVILDMFTNPLRAFYRSARTYPLPPIDQKELSDFIRKRFVSTSKRISNAIAKEIAELSRCSPYHVQMLAAHVWARVKEQTRQSYVNEAVEEIMREQDELFFSWYDALPLRQRAALCVLSKEPKIFSEDVRIHHGLGSSSSVQASVKSLENKNLVIRTDGGYRIFDPFFEMWIVGLIGRE